MERGPKTPIFAKNRAERDGFCELFSHEMVQNPKPSDAMWERLRSRQFVATSFF